MSSVLIDNNNCLLIQSDDLSKFLLHPQWLRERLSEPDYVDTNNKQRLYEPSLLNQDLKIIEYSLDGNNLNIHFSDGANGTLSLQNLLSEINKTDIIPLKTPWKNNFTKLPIFDHEKLSNQKNLIKMLENFQQLGFVIISNILSEKSVSSNLPVKSSLNDRLFLCTLIPICFSKYPKSQ